MQNPGNDESRQIEESEFSILDKSAGPLFIPAPNASGSKAAAPPEIDDEYVKKDKMVFNLCKLEKEYQLDRHGLQHLSNKNFHEVMETMVSQYCTTRDEHSQRQAMLERELTEYDQ